MTITDNSNVQYEIEAESFRDFIKAQYELAKSNPETAITIKCKPEEIMGAFNRQDVNHFHTIVLLLFMVMVLAIAVIFKNEA